MVYNPNYLETHSGGETVGSFLHVYITLIFLYTAVVMDLRTGRIPNRWICVGLAAGTVLLLSPQSALGPGSFFLGFLIPFLIGWIPFRMRAIGAGDIKLFFVVGCLNGGEDVFYCIFFSFLLGAGISLSKLLSLRQLKAGLMNCFQYFINMLIQKKVYMYPGAREKSHTIHFSAAIFLGYIVWLGVKACKVILLL